MFGLKDVFTTINLMGGVVAVALCIEGEPFWAGVSVMLGYLCGDAVDGWVARKLGTSNEFGAEYDTIADHMAHCIAPGAIVYTVYRDAGLLDSALHNKLLAIFLGGSIIVAASIRHARNIVAPVHFKGIWAGLPRSLLGFIPIGYVNASLAPHIVGGMWIGVVMIPLLGVFTLTRLPFPSHHLPRKHHWYVRILIAGFFITTFGILAVWPNFMFDVLFVWMFGYAMLSWIGLTVEERRAFQQAVRAATSS